MIQIIHPDGRTLYLDSATVLNVSEGAAIAQHPVESGSPAADHAEPTIRTLSLQAVITETPTTQQSDRTQGVTDPNALTQAILFDVLRKKTGPDRVRAAASFLQDCVGHYLTLLSDRWFYRDCLLAQWPYDWKLVRSSAFNLEFVVVRVVAPKDVRIPPRPTVPAGLSDPVDQGTKGTISEPDSSILFILNPFKS